MFYITLQEIDSKAFYQQIECNINIGTPVAKEYAEQIRDYLGWLRVTAPVPVTRYLEVLTICGVELPSWARI